MRLFVGDGYGSGDPVSKKATASSLRGYEIEGDRVPQKGDLSIITNWAGQPKCVIRTEKVRILPFRDVDEELARLEGEGGFPPVLVGGAPCVLHRRGKEIGI